MLKDFREFAVRGNVVDMAVGIIIGAAFGRIVSSLVEDVLMPPLGLVTGDTDFTDSFLVLRDGAEAAAPYATLAAARAAGAVTLNYGVFISALISFLIVAFAVFMLVRGINRLRRQMEKTPEAAPTSKECIYCLSSIPIKAIRCPQCTSQLDQPPGIA